MLNDKKRLSLIRSQLEEQLVDDAHHIAEWGIEKSAEYTGTPLDEIEDDENLTNEPQIGWLEELEERRTSERAEYKREQTEHAISRDDLGGAHRIAAALARNGGKA